MDTFFLCLISEKLLDDREISQEVFEFIKSDRYLFYQALLGATYKIKYFDIVFENKNTDTQSIVSALETALTKIQFDAEHFLSSKWAYFYFESICG